MSPYAVLGLAVLAVMATVILALAFAPRRKREREVEPALAGNGYHFKQYRGGGTVTPRSSFGQRAYAPPRQKNTTIFLTPRQIERVNIQRKLAGRPPFNRKGLTNAIAHPWDRADVRQPQSSNDWLSYLIMYEILFADHQSHVVSGCGGGVTIDTDAPYNGHGGEYAGGGASGDWSDNSTRATAAAIDHGIGIVGEPETAAPDPYVGIAAAAAASVSDSAPSYSSAPDPTPSYSAPDPTPSYSAPDPSPSFDSSSSSSGGDGS